MFMFSDEQTVSVLLLRTSYHVLVYCHVPDGCSLAKSQQQKYRWCVVYEYGVRGIMSSNISQELMKSLWISFSIIELFLFLLLYC